MISNEKQVMRSGLPGLDYLLRIPPGIITLRAPDPNLLSFLTADMIVRNHCTGKKILYFHWVDYHKRYWTIDADMLMRLAKRAGADYSGLCQDLHFVRAFSKDSVESKENWAGLRDFAQGIGFAVLDSVSELYEGKQKKVVGSKFLAYAASRFTRICMTNRCHGLVLDHSSQPIHPYVGELSSVIIELRCCSSGLEADLIKHPMLPDSSFRLSCGLQRTLRSWTI